MRNILKLTLLLAGLQLLLGQPAMAEQAKETAQEETRKTNKINMLGFDCADKYRADIAKLNRGKVQRFIAEDIARQLYSQDPGSVLMSVACVKEPVVKNTNGEKPTLDINFVLSVKIAASNGTVWMLNVENGYLLVNPDSKDDDQQLRLDFKVNKQQQIEANS